MAVSWTSHRFSGGNLALDTTNTVVLRGHPGKTFDRFDDPDEIRRFAEAASGFRADELQNRSLGVADSRRAHTTVTEIREAADRLFRHSAQSGRIEAGHLAPFLLACSKGVAAHSGELAGVDRRSGSPSTPIAIEAAVAISALSVLSGDMLAKVRICPNCNWLFLDRSRNSSRLWCDMAVCGNRQKAKRHYRRRGGMEEPADA